jgi:hypothetical protein
MKNDIKTTLTEIHFEGEYMIEIAQYTVQRCTETMLAYVFPLYNHHKTVVHYTPLNNNLFLQR